MSTQQIGPHDIMNEAVYMMINTRAPIPMTSRKENMARASIPAVIPAEPMISRGFLPSLSTVKIATRVKMMFTMPMTTV